MDETTKTWLSECFGRVHDRFDHQDAIIEKTEARVNSIDIRVRAVEQDHAALKSRVNLQGGILGIVQAISTVLGISFGKGSP